MTGHRLSPAKAGGRSSIGPQRARTFPQTWRDLREGSRAPERALDLVPTGPRPFPPCSFSGQTPGVLPFPCRKCEEAAPRAPEAELRPPQGQARAGPDFPAA